MEEISKIQIDGVGYNVADEYARKELQEKSTDIRWGVISGHAQTLDNDSVDAKITIGKYVAIEDNVSIGNRVVIDGDITMQWTDDKGLEINTTDGSRAIRLASNIDVTHNSLGGGGSSGIHHSVVIGCDTIIGAGLKIGTNAVPFDLAADYNGSLDFKAAGYDLHIGGRTGIGEDVFISAGTHMYVGCSTALQIYSTSEMRFGLNKPLHIMCADTSNFLHLEYDGTHYKIQMAKE